MINLFLVTSDTLTMWLPTSSWSADRAPHSGSCLIISLLMSWLIIHKLSDRPSPPLADRKCVWTFSCTSHYRSLQEVKSDVSQHCLSSTPPPAERRERSQLEKRQNTLCVLSVHTKDFVPVCSVENQEAQTCHLQCFFALTDTTPTNSWSRNHLQNLAAQGALLLSFGFSIFFKDAMQYVDRRGLESNHQPSDDWSDWSTTWATATIAVGWSNCEVQS